MNSTTPKINQKKIAEAANLDRAFFNKIFHGKVSCPPKVAIRLEVATGVPRAIWVFGTSEDIRKAISEKFQGETA